jgi:hypothetical protein
LKTFDSFIECIREKKTEKVYRICKIQDSSNLPTQHQKEPYSRALFQYPTTLDIIFKYDKIVGSYIACSLTGLETKTFETV